MNFEEALAQTTEERIEAAFREWWNDTLAKDYPIRMFLWTGVSLGALMLGARR